MLRYSRYVVSLSTAALCCALAAWAQDLSLNNDPNRRYTLSGTIVNSVTGRPIPRVLVHLVSPDHAVLTNAQGGFSFENVPPGTVEILVNKPGYFRPGASTGRFRSYISLSYKVEVGPNMENPVLKLAPEAVISGTVQGEDEEPLEGAQVNVLMAQVADGRRQIAIAHRTAISDEEGNFRVAGLAPGRYYLSVKAARLSRSILGTQSAHGGETYPAIVYFPESSDAAGAAPIDLAAGQHQEAHFALKMVPSFKVAGVIVNTGEWKQINTPMFVDESQQPVVYADRFDRQSGAFEFRAVPAGAYLLQLSGTNRDDRFTPNFRKITVQSNLTSLRLTIQPGADIPIVVHTDFVHPDTSRGHCTSTTHSGEIHESDCSDYPAARLELHSLDFPMQTFLSDNGPLRDGFAIRGVRPGKYAVRAFGNFGGYIQSVLYGGIDILREPLVVPEDGSMGAIDVVVRDDPANLAIKVSLEKTGQQALVLVFSDPLTATEPQLRTNTTGGEVYTGPLAPGAYKIFAIDASQEFDYSNLEELVKYSSQAASVKVGANENARVAVDLIHIGE